jgi:hypothetical protein
MNSLQQESDGTWLISSRDTSTVFDVDMSTGQIDWRLGGRQSSFKLEPGATFSWQHDARQLAPNVITLFDNGGPPTKKPQSKGLVIRLNQANHTASLIRAATSPTQLWAQTQGDIEPLTAGDWWLAWGDTGEISEVGPGNQVLYLAHSPADTQIYRALRFSWTGLPSTPPALAVERPAKGPFELYASWNGATTVARWRVLSGASATALAPDGAVSADRGFETTLAAPRSAAFVAVQALDAGGQVLGTSTAQPTASAASAS